MAYVLSIAHLTFYLTEAYWFSERTENAIMPHVRNDEHDDMADVPANFLRS